MAKQRKLALIFMALTMALGCGSGSGSAAAPDLGSPEADTDDPGLCKVDPELAKTAKPKPSEQSCNEQSVSQMSGDCNDGDGVACYQLSACLAMAYMARDEMTDERKTEVFSQLLDVSNTACQDGIAQACLMFGGTIQEELKENPGIDKDRLELAMCDSYVRSCQLGGDCQSCSWSECGEN